VLHEQLGRTAIPRRFSTVTRQIWLNQVRLTKTRGKRAMSILNQPRFRASYDFLLLRAMDDESLEPLGEFWTEAQVGQPVAAAPQAPKKRRRRRRRRPSGARKGSKAAADS